MAFSTSYFGTARPCLSLYRAWPLLPGGELPQNSLATPETRFDLTEHFPPHGAVLTHGERFVALAQARQTWASPAFRAAEPFLLKLQRLAAVSRAGPALGAGALAAGLRDIFADPVLHLRSPDAVSLEAYLLAADVLERCVRDEPAALPEQLGKWGAFLLSAAGRCHFDEWRWEMLVQAGFHPAVGKAFGYFRLLEQWQEAVRGMQARQAA